MAYYQRAFPEVCEDLLGFIRQAEGSIQNTAGHGKSDYNAGSAILNISGDSRTLGVGAGVGLLKRKARVLISNEAKPNDSNDADSNGTHRRLFLVDSNIAADKSATGRITVAQRDGRIIEFRAR